MLNIWKIDYSAIHDGPGIRTSFYLKGCHLKCIWCSNPEGQYYRQNLIFKQQNCIDCGVCVHKCPKQAISITHNKLSKIVLKIDRNACDLCGICVKECTPNALEIWGKLYAVSELINIIERNRPIYRRSGGGITLTGGDPVFQAEGTLELLMNCRQRGIHTAIETSAYGDEEAFIKILNEVDWMFIDLKHMDPDKHLRLTGKSNDLIIKNLQHASDILKERSRTLVVRMVIIPGINDGQNVAETAKYLKTLSYLEGVELLPYHCYAKGKYEQLNLNYQIPEIDPPSEDTMREYREIISSYGLKSLQ